jgi:molybdate transport system regulatory protein
MTLPKPKPSFKLWLETDEGVVFGPGLYRLLQKISETGTLKASAEELGMSYRFAWGLIRKAEKRIGQSLVISYKGGRSGGGGARLTEMGLRYLEEFSHFDTILKKINENLTDTKIRAIVKSIQQKKGNTILSIRIESDDLDLNISDRPLINLNVGDTIVLDFIGFSISSEKNSN